MPSPETTTTSMILRSPIAVVLRRPAGWPPEPRISVQEVVLGPRSPGQVSRLACTPTWKVVSSGPTPSSVTGVVRAGHIMRLTLPVTTAPSIDVPTVGLMKPRPMPPCGASASRSPESTSTTPLGSTSVSLFTIARDGMSHQPLGAAATGSGPGGCVATASLPRTGPSSPASSQGALTPTARLATTTPAASVTRRRVRRRRPRVSAAEGRSRGGRVSAIAASMTART